ncbi:ABC transporter ATP-binding protein [Haloarcula salina]|uniref:Probable branched-chain amino acid transport ATP-binding protein LivG n=1 Tax=Haloarcula salina TaxID=1429914 RepID=A0AA41GAI3_9EURY|nr:ABC transporter ATP-binding protein [Haloarcula salina]MBV0903172.1 ABC transporter ATP-binding protein [Haloarcula salina]
MSEDSSVAPSPEETILAVEDLEKHFGGIVALDGVDLSVGSGITGLIGPNGAGKTTFFNCLTGFYTPEVGSITFQGADITGSRPAAVAKSGMVRTFQIPRELSEMTVLENLLLAPPDQSGERLSGAWLRGDAFVDDELSVRERALEMAEFFELDHLLDEPAGNLSGGQRKLLELARALLTDPEMVLLDEPLAGVNPTLEEKILDRIHDLEAQGYSFLFVEHDIEMIMNHCDRVIVLHRGEVLTTGTPEEVQTDDRVIEAYLGEVDV